MTDFLDAPQQSLNFVQNTAFQINTRVYETVYPEYDIARYITVDSSMPEWSEGSITYISDVSGAVDWQSGYAKDVPMAEYNLNSTFQRNHMAAIGYQWNVEEVGKAMSLRGQGLTLNLPERKAMAARLAYDQFKYSLLFGGAKATEKAIPSLLNAPGAVGGSFPADGTGASALWTTKTPAQIVRDINSLITGIWTATLNTELANTLILPTEAFLYLAQTPYSTTTMDTILTFIQKTNVYTIETGQPLQIVSSRAARGAGSGGVGRVVAYRNDASVLKFNLPMPLRFLDVVRDGALNYIVPGICRIGGLEVLRPAAIRYGDGATGVPS